MSSILEQGAAVLYTRMRQYAGVQTVYRRKGQQALSITAIPGRVLSETQNADGAIFRETKRDFVYARSDFATLDPPQPVKGDTIEQTVGNVVETFNVGGEDLTSPPFEEADSYGVAWRVHTKRVKRAG